MGKNCSLVGKHLKWIISSCVTWEKAMETWGAKNSICEGENAGTGWWVESSNCWSMPSSWLMDTPFKILVIRASERDAGWLGVFLRAWDVLREITHSDPLWRTVSTSGVQEHCKLKVVRVAIIRHCLVRSIGLKWRKDEVNICSRGWSTSPSVQKEGTWVFRRAMKQETWWGLDLSNSTGTGNSLLIAWPQV